MDPAVERLKKQAGVSSGHMRASSRVSSEGSWYVSREIIVTAEVGTGGRSTGQLCTLLAAVRTVSCFISFVGLGMVNSIFGATLIHLQMMSNSTDTQMSLSFLYKPTGMIAGAFLTMITFDRVRKDLFLAVACSVMSTATLCIPFCTASYLLPVALAFQGFGHGIISSGGNIYIVQMWKAKSGPFTQTLHFLNAMGGFLTPFIVGLLVEGISSDKYISANQRTNYSVLTNMNESRHPMDAMNISTNSSISEVSEEDFTNIRIIYGVVALVLFSAGALFVASLSFSCISKRKDKGSETEPSVEETEITLEGNEHLYLYGSLYSLNSYKDANKVLTKKRPSESRSSQEQLNSYKHANKVLTTNTPEVKTPDERPKTMAGKMVAVFIILVGTMAFACGGMEHAYGGWILSFLVYHIKTDFPTATLINSCYWAADALGRFLSIFTAFCVSARNILLINSIILCLSILLYITAYNMHMAISWIGTLMIGITIGPMFGQTITFYRDFVTDKSTHLSTLCVAFFIGVVIVPSSMGMLFHGLSPLWVLYTMLINASLFCTIVITLYFVTCKWSTKMSTL